MLFFRSSSEISDIRPGVEDIHLFNTALAMSPTRSIAGDLLIIVSEVILLDRKQFPCWKLYILTDSVHRCC